MKSNFHVNFALSLSLVLTGSSGAFAGEKLCVAEKETNISYVSDLRFNVFCDDGSKFDTKRIFTAILLPLPYHWGNTARKILSEEMVRRGYLGTPAAKTKGVAEYPLTIFTSAATTASYCTVSKTKEVASGIPGKAPQFDAYVTCSKNISDQVFKGINQTEMLHELDVRGMSPVMKYTPKGASYDRIVSVEVFRSK